MRHVVREMIADSMKRKEKKLVLAENYSKRPED